MSVQPATHGSIIAAVSLGTFHLMEAAYEPHAVVPPHDHVRSGWTLTLAGEYAERFTRERHIAAAGAVLAKPAAARHSNRFGPRGARCFLIGVDTTHRATHPAVSEALRTVSFHARGSPVPEILQRMHREFLAQDYAWTLVLEGLLLELAAHLASFARRPGAERHPRWLIRIREQLHAATGRLPTFAALAAGAGVHPVHVSRAFRRAFGTSPGRYVREIRIERAKQLLEHASLSISQIAAALGFTDQSHLTRTFQRITGTTPAAYRKRSRREDV